MGKRVTQRILTCDLCGKTPEDGEHMWEMDKKVLCEECCEKLDENQENEPEEETE